MLGEKIIALRKKQGMSQQELADRVHVVRQTISKWEKNLSVPDAAALVELADALDVTTAELLGESKPEINEEHPEIAVALARINEQLAAQNRRRSRIWRVIAWLLGILLAAQILQFASHAVLSFSESPMIETHTFIEDSKTE